MPDMSMHSGGPAWADGMGPGLHLVKALIPQEAPREEGPTGHCAEQPCLLVWNCPVWQFDQGTAIEIADAT